MTDPKYMREGTDFALGKIVEEISEMMGLMTELQLDAMRLLEAIGKTQRWGLDSVNPELPKDQQIQNSDWIYDTSVQLHATMIDFARLFPDEFKDVHDALWNMAKEMAIYKGEVTREEAEQLYNLSEQSSVGVTFQ